MEFKKYEKLDMNDLFDLYDYIESLYNTTPFESEQDYIRAKNKIRHILEIILDEDEKI